MRNSKKTALLFLPFLLLVLFILSTDPYDLPLPLLLFPFLLLGAGVYFTTRELLKVAPVSKKKSNLISAVFASVVLLGVLLQSIRQLSVKDLLILSVLLAGATFYVRRIDL